MAKITLPTNYVDDIMNTSVEGKRKYRMVYNDDNTVSFEDVTPYDQVGSDFGAGDINATNQAVNESFDKNKVIRDMDAIEALTQEGYVPDALALKDVNDSLSANTISKTVNLLNQLNNTYTTENDGYLYVTTNTSTKGYAYVTDSNGARLCAIGGTTSSSWALFLKKGMGIIIYDYSLVASAEFKVLG